MRSKRDLLVRRKQLKILTFSSKLYLNLKKSTLASSLCSSVIRASFNCPSLELRCNNEIL